MMPQIAISKFGKQLLHTAARALMIAAAKCPIKDY